MLILKLLTSVHGRGQQDAMRELNEGDPNTFSEWFAHFLWIIQLGTRRFSATCCSQFLSSLQASKKVENTQVGYATFGRNRLSASARGWQRKRHLLRSMWFYSDRIRKSEEVECGSTDRFFIYILYIYMFQLNMLNFWPFLFLKFILQVKLHLTCKRHIFNVKLEERRANAIPPEIKLDEQTNLFKCTLCCKAVSKEAHDVKRHCSSKRHVRLLQEAAQNAVRYMRCSECLKIGS